MTGTTTATTTTRMYADFGAPSTAQRPPLRLLLRLRDEYTRGPARKVSVYMSVTPGHVSWRKAAACGPCMGSSTRISGAASPSYWVEVVEQCVKSLSTHVQ